MKVTKVEKTRIAVSGKNEKGMGRGILYPTPNTGKRVRTVEEQVASRVEKANVLYGVFFKSDIKPDLAGHFGKIADMAAQSKDVDTFILKAEKYTGYKEEYVNKKTNRLEKKTHRREDIIYAPAGKSLRGVMDVYVREHMTDAWQEKEYRAAAVEILLCLCNKEYTKKLHTLYESQQKGETNALTTFLQISKKCRTPFINANTDKIEACFSAIMKQAVEEKTDDIMNCIDKIKHLTSITLNKGKKNEKVYQLAAVKFEYATEQRMEAVLVRMRKSLKRGTNAKIAVKLLQGLAQMDGATFSGTLKELCKDEMTKEELVKFMWAVYEDYHKPYIEKSIRNHDVKVQVQNQNLDLSSLNIEKVSKKKKYKAALTDTLERYASSPEEAKQTLLDIKGVLLEYFLWGDAEAKTEFARVEKLWQIPNRMEEYFDENFVPVDDAAAEKEEANTTLAAICNIDFQMEKLNKQLLKARVNYVNYGKYQQLMCTETDDFRKYWITYAKDFVEKNYVGKKSKGQKNDYYSTEMLLACWKDVIRFLCGKYMDIGKAVYHFAMPDVMSAKDHARYGILNEKYKDGISSFAYEAIKAEENIQRDIANTIVSATAAFSRSVIDAERQQKAMEETGKNLEDVLFLKDEEFALCMKENEEEVKKQLLRFYGGYSTINGRESIDAKELTKELLSHLAAIRNENFHFTNGKKKAVSSTYTQLLWANERAIYEETIKKKYYNNNVADFYAKETIQTVVEKLYKENKISEAQIPAFRSIWQRKQLPEYIDTMPNTWEKTDAKHVLFEGALYFLLKEIYYRDFILSEDAAKLFFEAVDNYANETFNDAKKNPNRDTKKLANSGKSFKAYVDDLKKKYQTKEITFGNVCQFINTEYNQQNSGKQEAEIYKHFKMLLPLCMRRAFQKYIDVNYAFIKQPLHQNAETELYLEKTSVACMDIKPELAHWFTFAHFMHPRQLNYLVGNFKDYIQYREDVVRRAEYAGQFAMKAEKEREQKLVRETVQNAKNILTVLEFVRNISGRISNEFSDYYTDKEAYANYMAKYIEFDIRDEAKVFDSLKYFCQNTLPNGAVIDIYADAENAKVLRNVEIARMYAGGDVVLPDYPKITKDEIIKYYKEKDIVAKLQAAGMCESVQEQKRITDFQKLKSRITLNEVTELFALVNDLLGQLVSLAYLRERDEMYLFLGFYHMALRHPEGWKDEILDAVDTGKYAVDKGLVLYQTVAVFDFGTKLLSQNKEGTWNLESGMKWMHFINNHKASYESIIPLFEVEKYGKEIMELRNYVDHSKYYVKHDKSILDLYSEFYTKFFGYSSKLRKSVLFNLQSTLEKYFVVPKIEFDGVTKVKLGERTKSDDFTYKYKDTAMKKNGLVTTIKTVKISAKSDTFMDGMKKLLVYRKG